MKLRELYVAFMWFMYLVEKSRVVMFIIWMEEKS